MLMLFRPAFSTSARATVRSYSSRRARRNPHSITVQGTSRPTNELPRPPSPPPAPQTQSLQDNPDPLSLLKPQSHTPVVRFYEQDIANFGTEPPRRVHQARFDADQIKARELLVKIRKLESEIEQLEHDDSFDSTIIRLKGMANDELDPDVEMLDEADPVKVRKELEALKIPLPPPATASAGRGPGSAAVQLTRLNNCMRHAYLATDPDTRPVIRQELWKAYKRAKLHVPGLLEAIPLPAWDLLFYSQAVRWKSNKKREEHMAQLLDDMKSIGIDGPPTKPPKRNGSN